MEETKARQLHVFFFPFMAQGHTMPTMDMAKLFASRGLKATIVTTSYYAQNFSKTIEKSRAFLGTQVEVLTIKIPCSEVGLPEGIESVHMVSSPENRLKFFEACGKLRPQLDHLLKRHRPDCLVADTFFPWAPNVAAESGIPTLIFHSTGYFSLCASLCVFLYRPQTKVSSDSEPFIIPNLPDQIELTRDKLPVDFLREDLETEFSSLYKATRKMEMGGSYGVLVNSFYELESAYVDHYRKVLGVKSWQIGPLCLYNKRAREAESSVDRHECLKWLDSKTPNSVIYMSFGSVANFNDEQLMEIATGLEASGKLFIWVVKREKKEGVKEEWLPEGFEGRMKGRGLIVRGWVPQVSILEHVAVGGFMTHCGWNSTLEGVSAGVPMVTWPIAAEQFYNEKLVTQVLRVGVEVSAKKFVRMVGDNVKREAIEKAVRRVMEGEEAEQMRSRVKGLAELAKRAVEEGGSSCLDLNKLIEELTQHRSNSS
ncbi:UDP-glucose flavonoid 3-O-glucosyltransferase 7-like [Humulus lupulus]|uniref:UDP-glucose flavonoid 3-O-glucosyltransferase 7-like n=1 Tax=Humulus lupulus TaxID=3486 RepID=UPI002B4155B9|nr:UDP-glucose flavonoid 3-O-glucosyltransferase 7-like [Humulus lupulus]